MITPKTIVSELMKYTSESNTFAAKLIEIAKEDLTMYEHGNVFLESLALLATDVKGNIENKIISDNKEVLNDINKMINSTIYIDRDSINTILTELPSINLFASEYIQNLYTFVYSKYKIVNPYTFEYIMDLGSKYGLAASITLLKLYSDLKLEPTYERKIKLEKFINKIK